MDNDRRRETQRNLQRLGATNTRPQSSAQNVPLLRKRVLSRRLEAILPRAHFRHRAQGRGSSLARDNPFLLSAVVVAFVVQASRILSAEDRVEIVRGDHVVAEVAHPRVGRVMHRGGVDRGRGQGYPRVDIITLAVEPLGQLSFRQPVVE